jgi:hypothetical protein
LLVTSLYIPLSPMLSPANRLFNLSAGIYSCVKEGGIK